jgi:NADPH2:quinone reductase
VKQILVYQPGGPEQLVLADVAVPTPPPGHALVAIHSLFLTRPSLGHYIQPPDELRWRVGEVFDMVARGAIAVRISGTYPLGEAATAHRDLEGRTTRGSSCSPCAEAGA